MQMEAILERLVGFDTVSHRSNLPLIDYAEDLLRGAGIAVEKVPDATGEKANLIAVAGPRGVPGIVLSAHVDVVPVEGQAWTRPPFRLTAEGGRLYGRGTTDMKGFAACALRAMLEAAARPLAAPLILCLSHDEEVGCRGVDTAIARMAATLPRPRLVLVGEPTAMQVVLGHKGKVALRSTATGRAMHSAAAPLTVNAIDLIADLILAIRAEVARAASDGPFDPDYPVPHATLHAGRVAGGVQVNIVAERATLDWEIRSPAGDDPGPRLARIAAALAPAVAAARARVPEAGIETAESWRYPGLAADPAAPGVALACRLAGRTGPGGKVSYGTEGGLFAAGLGADTVVCGPGSMDQGHIPDEWIEASELAAAQAMLTRLLESLSV